jgi:hypothetical protein
MKRVPWFICILLLPLTLTLLGCSASTSQSSGNNPPGPQDGSINMMISDASSEDWATIGVKVLSISLIPQGGGDPVLTYTAPSPAPTINLVELDQLGEILGNATIPAGTYAAASIAISANPGDVLLTVAADPESGFPSGLAGTTIPSSQIQIQHATGSTGSKTASVNVNFDSPLVVTANQSNALDLEFDLAHPAFIVEHVPPSAQPFWAVNFWGPLRCHHIWNLADFVLRHLYGTVTNVTAQAITVTKDYPVYPPTSPETAIPSSLTLQILPDATNGTIFYDVDGKTSTVIKDFSGEISTLNGKYVRVAARYQADGSLVAVRIWASSGFNSVWVSPEGHVLHVNTSTNTLTVQNELGLPVKVGIGPNTEFFFRVPLNAAADATPIGVGPQFLSNLVRGFKVHVSVDDPLASPAAWMAQTVDIEIARFDGVISIANQIGFTYTRDFFTPSDDYSKTLDYISSSTPNGKDASGNPIDGFKWWYFTFPTLPDTGANAIPDFVSATSGSVNFGGQVGSLATWGESYATWNDPAKANDWSALWTVLMPTPAPLSDVATPWVQGSNGGSFGMTAVVNGTSGNTASTGVNATPGSATLVYQVDMTGGIITVTPVDITTTNGLNTLVSNLVPGTLVKVYGVPQPDGTMKAYILFYYTGVLPVAV